MKTVRELLRDVDPLRDESTGPSGGRDLYRQTILAAASGVRAGSGMRSRPWVAVFVMVALLLVVVSFLGSRMWSPLVSDVQAVVRFEVRLAEDKPAAGLYEAKVSGSGRSIYLHDQAIVDNGDIAATRIVPGSAPSQYSIEVRFKASGAEKMRVATKSHIGKPVAILLDGQVVMAPVLRSPIDASAVVTGNFTRAQAERIVNGIEIQ